MQMKNYLNDGFNYQLKMKLGGWGVSQPSGKMVVNRNKLQSEKTLCVVWGWSCVACSSEREIFCVPGRFCKFSLWCFPTTGGTMRRLGDLMLQRWNLSPGGILRWIQTTILDPQGYGKAIEACALDRRHRWIWTRPPDQTLQILEAL